MGIKEIVFYDRYRRGLKDNPLKRAGSTQIMREEQLLDILMQTAPWAYYGNSQENIQKVTVSFSQMVQEVDECLKKMEE